MWLIILKKKKKCKSDLKLNHTQGQLKCFFKLPSCCTGWCWKTVRSDHCFTSVTDGRANEGGLPCGSDSKESACSEGDPGLIPGLRRSPGEGNGNSLQYSGLENLMDKGAWWATAHGVAQSWIWVNRLSTQRREKERVWENFWRDYSWILSQLGKGNSQFGGEPMLSFKINQRRNTPRHILITLNKD